MKRFTPLCIAAILTPAMAFSQVIVDDTWADGDRANTGPLQADWWSSSSTSGNSVEASVGSLGLISGSSGRGLHGTFAAQTLGINESLVATFTFTTPATIGVSKGGAFRFALMDLNDPGLAADLSSSSSSVNPLSRHRAIGRAALRAHCPMSFQLTMSVSTPSPPAFPSAPKDRMP